MQVLPKRVISSELPIAAPVSVLLLAASRFATRYPFNSSFAALIRGYCCPIQEPLKSSMSTDQIITPPNPACFSHCTWNLIRQNEFFLAIHKKESTPGSAWNRKSISHLLITD